MPEEARHVLARRTFLDVPSVQNYLCGTTMTPPAQDATPMVDAAAYDDDGRTYLEHSISGACVNADFARTLERANRALQAEVARLKEELADVKGPQFRARIAAATKTFRERVEGELQSALSAAESGRRDGERYRLLRKLNWHDSTLCVVSEPKQNVKLGAYCPSGVQLDEALDSIDAAIAAQERAK